MTDRLRLPSPLLIFGAKSLALGVSYAVKALYPDVQLYGFAVSSLKNNPVTLNGMKVYRISEIEDKSMCIFVATPLDIQPEVKEYLEEQGFYNYICMDWQLESYLMSSYYRKTGGYRVLPVSASDEQTNFSDKRNLYDIKYNVKCYMAKFYRDKVLNGDYNIYDWVLPIQVGAALTDKRVCGLTDDTGDNISEKNVNYCELTALYWIWKNELLHENGQSGCKYYGLYQYRRLLDINNAQMCYIMDNDVDVVLPLPTMCEPDISEHHERYVKDGDWSAMLLALKELYPEYMPTYDEIYKECYMYNYNILLAKREVLTDYCEWLFSILKRTEELSFPKGKERADRYIGYLGENLLTLYFMHNRDRLKIYHTGRVMLV